MNHVTQTLVTQNVTMNAHAIQTLVNQHAEETLVTQVVILVIYGLVMAYVHINVVKSQIIRFK